MIETKQEGLRVTLPRHVRLRLAAAARVDVRTFERYWAGETVWPKNREDIDKALAAEGWHRTGDHEWTKTFDNSLDVDKPTLAITREVKP